MNPEQKIYVAGHRGMVGSAVVRNLQANGYNNLITRTSSELDLRDQQAADDFFAEEKPDVVLIAAAKVGGIHANSTYPAEFIYDNLAIALNAIHAAYKCGTKRLLFLGSTCIYPKEAPQPIKETDLLSSPLEGSNEAYAVAKIAGLKLCEHYRSQYGVCYHSAMPTNLYGPGDNYHPDNSHVIPALIRRFHEAKEQQAPSVQMWGTGKPRREFLCSDDLAEAIVTLLKVDNPPDLVNLGCGEDVSIAELAELVAKTVGYQGTITNDLSKPDGTMLKRTDATRIFATGWRPKTSLEDGLKQAYQCFIDAQSSGTLRAV
jgi:GDP-L-fucose synthase